MSLRDVAIKILPEAFTFDADRLAPFTREAQLLASLNHPKIGAIDGLEEWRGGQALVLEFRRFWRLGVSFPVRTSPLESLCRRKDNRALL